MRRFLNWFQSAGKASGARISALEARVIALEADERRKRKNRAKAIRMARLQHKWLQGLKDQPLTQEEKAKWMAGD